VPRASPTTRLLRALREVDLDDAATTFAQVRAASRKLGRFDRGEATLTRLRGQSPWERHAKGDELFYVIAGGLSFRLLGKAGARTVRVPNGGVFIVPKGVWHRSRARPGTVVLVVRGSAHGPVTFAADPRRVRTRDLVG
jgi:mannose-6-phosphate isomerase-like protein (cupin superfamily)